MDGSRKWTKSRFRIRAPLKAKPSDVAKLEAQERKAKKPAANKKRGKRCLT